MTPPTSSTSVEANMLLLTEYMEERRFYTNAITSVVTAILTANAGLLAAVFVEKLSFAWILPFVGWASTAISFLAITAHRRRLRIVERQGRLAQDAVTAIITLGALPFLDERLQGHPSRWVPEIAHVAIVVTWIVQYASTHALPA